MCTEALLQSCAKKNLDGQGADEEEYQARMRYWMNDYNRCPYCNNPDDTKCGHAHKSREELNRLLSSDW